MTYKSIIQILLVLAIISTICISIMKPKMHKPLMVLNSQFTVEHDDGIQVDEQNISVLVQDTEINADGNKFVENEGGINFVEPKIEDVQPINFSKAETNNQNLNFENQKSSAGNVGLKNNNSGVKTTPVKTTNNSVKSSATNVKSQPAATGNSVTTTQQVPKIDLNKIVNNNQKIINTPPQTNSAQTKTSSVPAADVPVVTTKPKTTQPVQSASTTEVKPPIRVASQTTSQPQQPVSAKTETKPVVLTAAQEEIAWNKWRSNLNNQIMKDSKLPTMPNGIIFKYKFTVDKYGKISNVQTTSTTPGYTPYAIQFIAPVIRSYQGRAILNFPTGSNRTSTEVSGAWKISNSSKLSTPDDYHDIEKIKK